MFCEEMDRYTETVIELDTEKTKINFKSPPPSPDFVYIEKGRDAYYIYLVEKKDLYMTNDNYEKIYDLVSNAVYSFIYAPLILIRIIASDDTEKLAKLVKLFSDKKYVKTICIIYSATFPESLKILLGHVNINNAARGGHVLLIDKDLLQGSHELSWLQKCM